MDVWGAMYRDHFEGQVFPHVIERDDGLAHQMESADAYFKAPRSELERRLLARLEGPVLDLGAGAGSHALYLQGRGLVTTAIDSSPCAIEVCRRRGCRDARVMDLRQLTLERGHYAAFIVMGNTLGIHQTPESLPAFLNGLAEAARPNACLLCATLDPLHTTDPRHLSYHARNRARGQPPGLSIIRLRYRAMVDDWVPLWMPTADELTTAVAGSAWRLVEEHPTGANRLRLLRLGGQSGARFGG